MSDNLCRWCGKPIGEGDRARDPANDAGRLHVRCAATCRERLRCWAEVAAGPIGEAVNLLAEYVAYVQAEGRVVVHADSPGQRQLADAVASARGERPWTPTEATDAARTSPA